MVLESNLTRHHVVCLVLLLLLLLLFLSLLMQIGFFQALLRYGLISVEMVRHVLIGEVRRRVRCGNDMVCDFLGALGQVETGLVSLGFLSHIGLVVIGIVEGIFR